MINVIHGFLILLFWCITQILAVLYYLFQPPLRQILGNKPYIQGAGFNKLPTIFKRRRHRLIISLHVTFLTYLVTSNILLFAVIFMLLSLFFFHFIYSFYIKQIHVLTYKVLMKRKPSFKIMRDGKFIFRILSFKRKYV